MGAEVEGRMEVQEAVVMEEGAMAAAVMREAEAD